MLLMKIRISLLRSQDPEMDQTNSVNALKLYAFHIHAILSFYQRQILPRGILSSRFPTLNPLQLITPVIFGGQSKLWV